MSNRVRNILIINSAKRNLQGGKMLKKLAKCVGKYKWHAIKTPIYVACECVFDVIIPFLMAFLMRFTASFMPGSKNGSVVCSYFGCKKSGVIPRVFMRRINNLFILAYQLVWFTALLALDDHALKFF